MKLKYICYVYKEERNGKEGIFALFRKKNGIAVALLGLFVLSLLGVQLNAKADHPSVYVIPVEKMSNRGSPRFYRVLSKKRRSPARHIILDINTPGGAVQSALDIADIIGRADVPVTAYVNKRALSAGAYIALQADEIYMAPGGKMGAATIIDGKGNAADKRPNHCGMQKWRTRRLKTTEIRNTPWPWQIPPLMQRKRAPQRENC